jgi:integrase
VFDRGDGKRRDMRSARERFARIVKDLGLPPLTPHGLRHTVASYLFQRRVPALLISRLLGHASVAITQDLYTHISDDDRGEVARAIEGALGDERTERVS